MKREVIVVAKKSQGSQTPNEKYNAEFGEENVANKVKQAQQNKVKDNFQTPDEKFNAEFGSENTGKSQK
jgi:small acid-soluble spore protein E (minor gamma-type SASP)